MVQAAHELGIAVGRSQIRRILLAEGPAGGGPARGPAPATRSSPQRTQVIALSTSPPAGVTVVCADELGPVLPRTFPPAPGWSADGHRVKAPLAYSRGIEKTWV